MISSGADSMVESPTETIDRNLSSLCVNSWLEASIYLTKNRNLGKNCTNFKMRCDAGSHPIQVNGGEVGRARSVMTKRLLGAAGAVCLLGLAVSLLLHGQGLAQQFTKTFRDGASPSAAIRRPPYLSGRGRNA